MSPALARRIRNDVVAVLADREIVARIRDLASEPAGRRRRSSPSASGATLRSGAIRRKSPASSPNNPRSYPHPRCIISRNERSRGARLGIPTVARVKLSAPKSFVHTMSPSIVADHAKAPAFPVGENTAIHSSNTALGLVSMTLGMSAASSSFFPARIASR
jgi:hypothetical protein